MAEQSSKLGVIGGMGPEATAVFYARLLARTDAQTDQAHIPAVILSDTEMPDRTRAILEGRGDEIFTRLLADARLLVQCGCTALAIPCNTTHFFWDRLQAEVPVPILHMPREAARRLTCTRAGILATDGALRAGVYQTECAARGIEAVLPSPEMQTLVMRMIYEQVKAGRAVDEGAFRAVDAHLRARGCQAAILACTELSVYANSKKLPDFYIDAMEVLTETAVILCGRRLRGEGTI